MLYLYNAYKKSEKWKIKFMILIKFINIFNNLPWLSNVQNNSGNCYYIDKISG